MTDIRIITTVLGPVQTNCYFLINEKTQEALIIDPADDAEIILAKCKKLQIKPAAILLTHGHFDHIGAKHELKNALNIPVYAGAEEKELLADEELNGSAKIGRVPIAETADVWVKGGDVVEEAGLSIRVIATPGHTSGSVCYFIEKITAGGSPALFCGDTLFAGSFGRTDFPTGDQMSLAASIISKLFVLPPETLVYPGHGESSDIGYEKRNNPIYRYRNGF
jgi:glyoxylase-like metal-dependent hydrolase (beta-lactamase superfamily II)